MNGQPGNPGTQALSLDQQVLGLFGNLSQEDQRQIKRQMIQTFTDMLQNKKGFLSSMEFIMAKANKPYEQKEKTSMVDQAEEFLKAPITRGLGYVDGENQIVNSPNPNQNGATNNSYYN